MSCDDQLLYTQPQYHEQDAGQSWINYCVVGHMILICIVVFAGHYQ